MAERKFESILALMRVLITLITALSVAALLALDNPTGFRSLFQGIISRSTQVLNDRELRIDGLELLSRSEVERLLPLDRSVVWWHLNATEVQTLLSQNPWIDESKVSSCPESWSSKWGCFLVRIKERRPVFLAHLNGNPWVMDREGRTIVTQKELASRGFVGKLIELKGAMNSSSPDAVRSQVSSASVVRDTIEAQVGRSVRDLEFLGQGDLGVGFDGVPFPIVFAAGPDARVSLKEQGERCSALLKQLSARFSDVARIDLAFDRVGIVRFK